MDNIEKVQDIISRFRQVTASIEKINEVLYKQRDINLYFKLIAQELAKVFGSESALVYLYENGDGSETLGSYGDTNMLADALAYVKSKKEDEKGIYSVIDMPEELAQKGVFSIAYVKLIKDEKVLGKIILLNAGEYTKDDLGMLRAYASQVLLSAYTFIRSNKAFDNSLFERDLELIRKQQNLIMQDEISHDDEYITVDYLNIPYKYVGGDFCKFKKVEDKKYILFIADVMGHGIVSNYFVAMMKGAIELLLMENTSPAEIMKKLNTILFKELDKLDVFITAKMMYLDFESKKAYSSNAGHTNPILVHKDENSNRTYSLISEDAFIPFGVVENIEYTQEEIDISDMELIALYTDGIIEEKDGRGREFGTQNLGKYLIEQLEKGEKDICKGIFKTLEEFSGNSDRKDDLTMVTLRVMDF